MPRRALTWVISDTHFYHDAIIEACNRPADHVEQIMRNCRYLLAEQDTLIHLGDVIFYKYPELKGMLDSIKGRKILVMGNHDLRTRGWYERNGFSFAADAIVLGDVIFTHKPCEVFPSGARFNVHGHWHLGLDTVPAWHTPQTHYLFSLERLKYFPVKLDEILAKLPRVSVQTGGDSDAAVLAELPVSEN